MSMRLRLTFWYTAILFVTLASFAAIIGQQIFFAKYKDLDVALKVGARDARGELRLTGDVFYAPGASVAQVNLVVPSQDRFDRIEQQDGVYVQLFDNNGNPLQRSSGYNTFFRPSPADVSLAEHLLDSLQDYRLSNGQSLRIYWFPVNLDEHLIGIVVAAKPVAPVSREVRTIALMLAVGTLGATVLLALIVYAVAQSALRPISRMARDAARIQRAQDLSRRVRVPGTRDEVAALARTFNGMLGRLEAAFESQRRFIADASHELRTPLTAIRGNADVMRQLGEQINSAERAEILEEVAVEAERMSRLVNDLLTLARAQVGEQSSPRPVRFDEALESAVRTARGLARGHTIVHTPSETPFWVVGDSDRLKQLALILLDNAVKYTPPEGHIWVWLSPVGQQVELRVADDGPGIPADRLPHLFERFYRGGTPARGRDDGGAGLGLAIAQEIVYTFEGTMSVESSVGHGTAFIVRLPRIEDVSDDLLDVSPDAASGPEPDAAPMIPAQPAQPAEPAAVSD